MRGNVPINLRDACTAGRELLGAREGRVPKWVATASAVSKPGHVRNAAKSGSKFRTISGSVTNVIHAPKLEPRIMRYELSDYQWTAIKPMLPNKPRSVRRVNDRRVLNGIL
jgi:hypothetical protein